MLEKKQATYFELVDLLERIFPPKSEFDYIKISPEELIDRFNEEVEKSGYYFKEETLVNARKVIAELQRKTYKRNSIFIGAREGVDYGFDQNHYSIQNHLSEIKVRILSMMHDREDLIHPGYTMGVTRLGSVEELRGRLTKESIKEYVSNVLRTSWEKNDTIRPEIYNLVADILYHFGISTRDFLGENKTSKIVEKAISDLEFKSRDFHGPMHHDGGQYFADSATTNLNRYEQIVEETINKITEEIFSIIRDTLDKVEAEEKIREQKKAETLTRTDEPLGVDREEHAMGRIGGKPPIPKGMDMGKPISDLDKMFDRTRPIGKPSEVGETREAEPEEVTVEELEGTVGKFKALQELATENLKLAQELAELQKRAAEIQKQIENNNEKIRKLS